MWSGLLRTKSSRNAMTGPPSRQVGHCLLEPPWVGVKKKTWNMLKPQTTSKSQSMDVYGLLKNTPTNQAWHAVRIETSKFISYCRAGTVDHVLQCCEETKKPQFQSRPKHGQWPTLDTLFKKNTSFLGGICDCHRDWPKKSDAKTGKQTISRSTTIISPCMKNFSS